MIDIHSHILFGVDDGAAEPSDSLALARIYVKAGYRQVVATPHAEVDSYHPGYLVKTIRGRVQRLNQYLHEHSVALKILPGMEVGLDPHLPKAVGRGDILPLADTKYLLVETPFGRLPLNWSTIVDSLAAKGITVIWAHPERCAQVADKPEILGRMAWAGAKFQVNWDSFSGVFGKQVAHVARFMARKGIIHCLATDSHDAKARHAGNVQMIAKQLNDLIGAENLKRIAAENPARVIRGENLLEMKHREMPNRILGAWFWKPTATVLDAD